MKALKLHGKVLYNPHSSAPTPSIRDNDYIRTPYSNEVLLYVPKAERFNYFTVPRITTILEKMAIGLRMSDAAKGVGLSAKLVNRWYTDNKGNFGLLVDIVEMAHKEHHVKKIFIGEPGMTTASMWYLSRKYKKEYGDKVEVKNTGPVAKQSVQFGGTTVNF